MRAFSLLCLASGTLTLSFISAFAGKDLPKVDPRGPKPPPISGVGYQVALGKLAAAKWTGPMTVEDTSANMVRDTDACFDGGRRCWYRFQAPTGNNELQVERIIGVGPDRVERYRLIPGECTCTDVSDDRDYPWKR